MRCGQTTGMREPMRMISTWSMARTRSRMLSSCSSESTSGSPPLISTSRTSVARSMYSMALSISVLATMSSVPPTRRRRVQWRQYMLHISVTTKSTRSG